MPSELRTAVVSLVAGFTGAALGAIASMVATHMYLGLAHK